MANAIVREQRRKNRRKRLECSHENAFDSCKIEPFFFKYVKIIYIYSFFIISNKANVLTYVCRSKRSLQMYLGAKKIKPVQDQK